MTKSRTENPGDAPVQPATSAPAVDQVRPLSELALQASQLDAGGAPAPGAGLPAAAPAGPDTSAKELAAILGGLRNAADPLAVELGYMEAGQIAAIWSDDTLENIAGPLVEIMRRAGWNLDGAMDRWGPYAALLMGVAGPAFLTWKVAKLNKAAAKAPAADEGQGGGQQQPA